MNQAAPGTLSEGEVALDLARSALRITWVRNGAYAHRLVDDLPDESFFAQPTAQSVTRPAINHPAWILCHLNRYAEVIVDLLLARPFEDPAGSPFARGSRMSLDPRDYPDAPTILARYGELHDEALAAIDHVALETLRARNPIERWRPLHPHVFDQLVTLMVKHESFHLGQLSAWRRAMGFPPVDV